jgi:hypothetical protein
MPASAPILSRFEAARLRVLRFTQFASAPASVRGRSSERRKPANLIYDVDEVPPLSLRLVLALQHVFVTSVGWIFVVVMVNAIGGTAEQAGAIMRVSMVASGLATILRRGFAALSVPGTFVPRPAEQRTSELPFWRGRREAFLSYSASLLSPVSLKA